MRKPLATPRIIHEAPGWLALWKPPGWAVQGAVENDRSLIRWIRSHLGCDPEARHRDWVHVVHRIDGPVSGLVLFARNPAAASALALAFEERRTRKDYLALAHGNLPGPPTRMRCHQRFSHGRAFTSLPDAPGAQAAVLAARVVAARDGLLLLRVRPFTGRRHQIRLQLAAAGCPLQGDTRYGAPGRSPLPRDSVGLHAWRIRLPSPENGSLMTLTAPPPPWWPDWALAALDAAPGTEPSWPSAKGFRAWNWS